MLRLLKHKMNNSEIHKPTPAPLYGMFKYQPNVDEKLFHLFQSTTR